MSDYLDSTKELIAQYIKLRKNSMSQHKLESETGVKRQVIMQYENGEVCPTVKALNRLLEPMGYELTIQSKKADEGNGKTVTDNDGH